MAPADSAAPTSSAFAPVEPRARLACCPVRLHRACDESGDVARRAPGVIPRLHGNARRCSDRRHRIHCEQDRRWRILASYDIGGTPRHVERGGAIRSPTATGRKNRSRSSTARRPQGQLARRSNTARNAYESAWGACVLFPTPESRWSDRGRGGHRYVTGSDE